MATTLMLLPSTLLQALAVVTWQVSIKKKQSRLNCRNLYKWLFTSVVVVTAAFYNVTGNYLLEFIFMVFMGVFPASFASMAQLKKKFNKNELLKMTHIFKRKCEKKETKRRKNFNFLLNFENLFKQNFSI